MVMILLHRLSRGGNSGSLRKQPLENAAEENGMFTKVIRKVATIICSVALLYCIVRAMKIGEKTGPTTLLRAIVRSCLSSDRRLQVMES